MSIQTKYFVIAVVIIGSIGVWLPILLELLIEEKVTFHNVPPNITTYFVSLLFAGCIDFLLGRIRDLNISGLASVFLNFLFLGLFGLALVVGAILLNIFHHDIWSFLLGVVGVFISYYIWWIANINNPNFVDTHATLGGNPQNPLTNG